MLVVSDLDGTLLDHTTYSFAAARPALAELARLKIPVILNTSKTRAELGALLQKIGLATPYIVENGSAIYSAEGSLIKAVGTARAKLVAALKEARQAGFHFTSYSDMSVSELVAHTGLTQEQAQQSLARDYTEPLIWRDSAAAMSAFISLLQAQNLQCIQGGRFLHIMGPCDKGMAMRELIRTCYPQEEGTVIALGDSANDRAMLELADIAVVVRSAKHEVLTIAGHKRLITTELIGPAGWNEAVLAILRDRV